MVTDIQLEPQAQVKFGQQALRELKALVQRRPEKEKLIINGKQYLYFSDWQILGAFFGITSGTIETKEVTTLKKSETTEAQFIETIGYWSRAKATQNGKEVSQAEAMCLREEPNWAKKPNFQLLSMAQTRACAKALRNCLQWVVRMPEQPGAAPTQQFAEETVEEIEQQELFE